MKACLKLPIQQMFKTNPATGNLFGIEIECNLNSTVEEPVSVFGVNGIGWDVESDGSLKKNGLEFVTKVPEGKISSLKKILKLKKFIYKDWQKEILDSQKAGTHIHLNVNDLTGLEVFKLMLIYYPLETVLLNKAGPGRQGNLFCLRLRDAPDLISGLENVLDKSGWGYAKGDELRYAALNFQSLFKYGTLEVRCIRTSPELDNIKFWLDVLERLKHMCQVIYDPWDEIVKISGLGPTEWARSILGEELFDQVEYDGMDEDIYEDMQMIQLAAHKLSKEIKNA